MSNPIDLLKASVKPWWFSYASAVGSFVFGLFVSKPAERLWEKKRLQWAAARRAKLSADMRAELSKLHFMFANVSANVFLADFQPLGYSENSLRTTIFDTPHPDVPSTERPSFDHFEKHWIDEVERGAIFDSDRIALQSATISSFGDKHEGRLLRLSFRRTTYVRQRTIASVFQTASFQKHYVQRSWAETQQVDQFLSETFGVSVAVISADGHLLFPLRSKSAAANPSRFTCGVAEGLSVADVSGSKAAPDLFALANRALKEELGLSLQMNEISRIKLTALILDQSFYEWGLLGYLDLRGTQYTTQVLIDYHKNAKAKDKWEAAGLEPVIFTPEKVALFLSDHNVTNYGVVCAVLTLLSLSVDSESEWGREQVVRAFEQHYKKN